MDFAAASETFEVSPGNPPLRGRASLPNDLLPLVRSTEDAKTQKPTRSGSLIGAILLVPIIAAFSLGSCAKPESAAERNAEIDRRVDRRLEAEHQAEERQRLALRQAELDARERALAAQETSFATMTASVPSAPISSPADAGLTVSTDSSPNGDSYATQDTYPPYPASGGQFYPEPYGFVSENEPYLGAAPYFFASTTSLVTIVNQNTRIAHLRRCPARAGRGHRNPGPSAPAVPPHPSLPRQVGTGHRPMGGMPIQTTAHRPTQPAVGPQVVNRRPAGKVGLQRTR